MKKVALSEVKDDLSHYVDRAQREEIVITRHGRPAAILIGFKDEDAWFDYRLEHDPRFVKRIEDARRSYRQGRGVPIEQVRERLGIAPPPMRRTSPSEKRSPPPRTHERKTRRIAKRS